MNREWRPAASLERLRLRAELLAGIRRFFEARGVLEVETPVLAAAGVTDPHLQNLLSRYTGPGHPHGLALYLQTSPEFAMKRLLAAGSGSIYQLGKAFRDGEAGRRHNPEFTLLEWYRVGFDHHRLMQDVAELVTQLLRDRLALAPAERLSYREAFERHAGIDPLRADSAAFRNCALRHGLAASDLGDDLDAWRDLLLTQIVEPRLGQGRLGFLYDYPVSQAALARLSPRDPAVAERFELYLNGIELANGFHELGDAAEQRRRFEHDNIRRRALGLPERPIDERLLAALEHGLPEVSGVALGVDRLVMLAAGATSLDDVLAFPIDRA